MNGAGVRNRGILPYVMAVVVLIATLAVGIATRSYLGNHTPGTPITLFITIPDYKNQSATKIPVLVSGKKIDGEPVNRVMYVDSQGVGVRVEEGAYSISFPSSPLSEDGMFWTPPAEAVDIKINSEGLRGDADRLSFTFEKADYAAASDEKIQAAREYAADSGESQGHIEKMVQATLLWRESIAPAIYSFSLKGSDGATWAEGDPFRWVEFTSDDEGSPIAGINKELADTIADAMAESASAMWYGGYVSAQQSVSYFDGGIACVVFDEPPNPDDPYDGLERTSRTFNLDQGYEISPGEVVGLSEDELWGMCAEAVRASMEKNPSAMYGAYYDYVFNDSMLHEKVSLVLMPDGVYAFIPSTVLDSSSDDPRFLKVCDLEGTQIADGVNHDASIPEVASEMQGTVGRRSGSGESE